MADSIKRPQLSPLGHRLLLGWRKGRAMHDPLMWSLLLTALLVPALLLVAGAAMTEHAYPTILASPLFWLAPGTVLGALVVRLHYLATLIGCVRQINFSEDGQPSACQIDLGHRECCKHIGPDGRKQDCPYWRPELILD